MASMEPRASGWSSTSAAAVERFLQVRGAVRRRRTVQQLTSVRDAPIIHLQGGVGWGKTVATFGLALELMQEEESTLVIRSKHDLNSIKMPDNAGSIVYVIDDVPMSVDQMQRVLSSVSAERTTRVLVASRQGHPLLQHAVLSGLRVATLDEGHLACESVDVAEMARARSVRLPPSVIDYVTREFAGWPLGLSVFLGLWTPQRRRRGSSSALAVDEIVDMTFARILEPLLGRLPLEPLAHAALTDRVPIERPSGPGAATSPIAPIWQRARELGLVSW
ncbi:hypothetical protein [Microbacterium sp. A84]|uniref:hypothetical protein n=1 Tax=Microbacterium sp. A84 TaxID=3450715 RepID=UPI003F4409C4